MRTLHLIGRQAPNRAAAVPSSKRSIQRWAILAFALASAACTRTVATEGLSNFSKAATDLAEQSQLAFTASNKLARDTSIDEFVRSGAPGLSEQSFQVAIDRESLIAWQESLTALSDYSSVLATLVDSKRGAATSDAVIALGQRLQAGTLGLKIDPNVQGGFAALGGALVNARAEREALAILQQTDPSVQQILGGMANAIGASDREGLRGTVFTNWNASFRDIRSAYAKAAVARQEASQRQLIDRYLAGLEKRDAHLQSLANLRTSLVNLAAAHAAAAKGAPITVDAALAQIDRSLEETKRLLAAAGKNDAAKAGKEKEATNGSK